MRPRTRDPLASCPLHDPLLPFPANLENLALATELEKMSFHTFALISHASKVIFKILQAWLQQYMNGEIPDVQAGFRKGRETRDQIANIHWITEKQENSRKTSTSTSLTKLI